MGLTVKTDDKGVTVFATEKEGQNGKFKLYSIGVSSKDSNNNWVSGYVSCRFKKGVEVANKSKIKINNAFYVVNKSNGKSYVSLMITNFETLEGGNEFVDTSNIKDEELPFAD